VKEQALAATSWTRRASWLLPWGALSLVWLEFVRPLPRYDFRVFVHAGAQVLAGHDPYLPLTSPALYGGSAYVYPWLVAFPFVPFALLPATVADLLFMVLSAGALIAGCRLAGLRNPLLVVLVLVSQPSVRSFEVGSINAWLFLACVLAWRHREQAGRVALAVTAAVSSKLFLLPLLGWLAATRRWRALLLSGTGIALVVGASTLFGPVSLPDYLRMLNVLGRHEGRQGLSLYHLLTVWLPGTAAQAVCTALAGALAGAGLLAARRRRPGDDLLTFTCLLLAAMVLTPILWSHYILLTFVPVLLAWPSARVVALTSGLSWLLVGVGLPWKTCIVLLHTAWLVLLLCLARSRRTDRVGAPAGTLRTAPSPVESVRALVSPRGGPLRRTRSGTSR
jgi:alpha-1,2-mannosyltransferase